MPPLFQTLRHFRPVPSSAASSSSSAAASVEWLSPTNPLLLRLFFFRSFYSPAASEALKALSFTADYLVRSCGLSPSAAAATSHRVHFSAPERPDSVLALFRSYGFSGAQISKLVRRRPSLLLATPESCLRPKLDFFRSFGVPRSDLAKILSRDPTPLCRSLKKHIVPSYNFFFGFLQSDKKIVSAMKRTSWVFLIDCSKNLAPNIDHMGKLGVPKSCLSLLFAHFPESLLQSHVEFVENVKEVLEMGFDPRKTLFVLAVHVITGKGNRAIMGRCKEVYSKWGWSEDDTIVAFRKHPNCMILSEGKINRTMEYLVKEMGWPAKRISQCPAVLFFSLDKRIIPRCEVIKALLKKGLVKKEFSLNTILVPPEGKFLDKFVIRYWEQLPELMSVYKKKWDLKEAR